MCACVGVRCPRFSSCIGGLGHVVSSFASFASFTRGGSRGVLTPQPPLPAGRGGAAAAPGRWCGTRLVGLAALAAAVVAGAGGAQALVGVDAGVVAVAPDGG